MSGETYCEVCRRPWAGYRFQRGAFRCGRHALTYRPVLRRALLTTLLVGSVLIAINQGDRLLRGEVTRGMALKMALTYCVPFAVSTSGALGAARLTPAADDRERRSA
jgi:hypothetical protein